MKRLIQITSFFLYFFCSINSIGQTAIAPSVGDGSPGNPYQIATLENLYWIAESNTRWGYNYIQLADIDASETSSWFGGTGWTAIGNATVKFTGAYDGYGYKISGLFINRPSVDYQGLFGYLEGASIYQLTIEGIQISANNYVAGIAGQANSSSSFYYCHIEGDITGQQNVGGIVGFSSNNSYIEASSSNVNVIGRKSVGGLVGNNQSSSFVVYSYSKGSVTATSSFLSSAFGGLVGTNSNGAAITSCFSNSKVISGNDRGGGLVGENFASINSCYSTGSVSLLSTGSNIGGLVGVTSGTTINSYWDIESSGNLTSAAGIGKTTIEMKTQSTFIGWDFDFFPEWQISSRYYLGYPYLGWMPVPLTPMISTTSVDNITGTRASVKGEFVSLGYTDPTQHGFCWSTSQNPTIADSKVELGSAAELKSFTSPIEGLSLSTTYYLRAFATNSHGTAYGEEIEFTTLPFNGSGTELDPFEIETLAQLKALADNSLVWDKHFIQTANIDATETSEWFEGKGWKPIGDFRGSYDGQGYAISNLYVDRLTESGIGLFSIVNGGTVQNLNLENSNIKGQANVGGLSGSINGGAIVTNVHVSGSIQASSNNCGGLVGNIGTGLVNNSSSSASVTGINITGGIIGYIQYNGIVQNTFSIGSVSSTGSRVGGFVGESYGDVLACYSTSNVQGVNYVGGFIGYGQSKPIVNSYSTGAVQGTSYIGGFAGYNFGKIYSCYSTGSVSGSSYVSGFSPYNAGIVTNCFWDKNASGYPTSSVGIGKTTVQMQDILTFTSATWDFKGIGTESIWNIGNDRNFGYPYLDWQYPTDKAPQIISFEDLTTKTYGDADFNLIASSTSGLTLSISSSNENIATINGFTVAIVGAGIVNLTVSQEGNETYNPAIDVVKSLTIAKKALSVTADNKTKTYDGNPFISFTSTFSPFVNDEDETLLSGSLSYTGVAVTAFNTGSYTITPQGVTSSNYEITFANGSLEIGKAPLTATAENKTRTYGAANPALTVAFDGFVNGEDASVINEPLASTLADATSSVGLYDITLAAGEATNYEITLVDGQLEITKAPLTATTESKTRTYGAANPEFTVWYDGFVNGENELAITEPTVSTLADANSPVGQYDITLDGGSATNYEITLVDGELEITKAPLTATAENKTRTYGATNPELTVAYSGFMNGENELAITEPTVSTIANEMSPVGQYNISLTGGEANNYELNLVDGLLEVTKANIVATAEDKTRYEGEENPTLTISYAGFVNGEDELVLDELPVSTTDATINSPAGEYSINPSGGSDNNYSFTYESGTLSVLAIPTYQVTFNIASSSSGAIAGVSITIDGESLTTSEQGEASIMLTNGTYSYTVSAEGFDTITDEVVVEDEEKVVTITLTPVGVDFHSMSSIKLYPNPFSNRLVIEKTSNIDLVQIVNIAGQVISVVNNNGMDEIILDGNNLTEGIYLIRLFDKYGNQIVKKVIKGSL